MMMLRLSLRPMPNHAILQQHNVNDDDDDDETYCT